MSAGRPKVAFADKLDNFLESASEQEIRDVAGSLATWARWKKLAFKIEIKPVKLAATPLLDAANGAGKS